MRLDCRSFHYLLDEGGLGKLREPGKPERALSGDARTRRIRPFWSQKRLLRDLPPSTSSILHRVATVPARKFDGACVIHAIRPFRRGQNDKAAAAGVQAE